MLSSLWNALSRKKRNDDSGGESKLARVLNLFDLTALGVGSTLGLGVYVLAGSVARDYAGPAVTLSFLIAAIASAIAGFCYAEFAARVPKAGSAYVYSYVSVGEFVAFTIGWNLILEYVIGTSSVARGLVGYVDTLIDNRIANYFNSTMPMNVEFMAEYPDFLSFVVILILAGVLATGVKESTRLNNVFTCVNMVTIAVMLVAGAWNAKPSNWTINLDEATDVPVDQKVGTGGFMPFGFAGVMAGAAKCFYGFVGFDCIATTGEEAKNPKRNIPLAIVISLIIIFFAYFGVSTVLTMMVPYYTADKVAPFPKAFGDLGWIEVKWIVSIGAIFALCTSLLGAMFPLPRVLYAMGNDGIIYKIFKRVHPKTMTPMIATALSGILAAVMALIFDLDQLIDMMSIGTLLAYTIVAICVLILHYECVGENQGNSLKGEANSHSVVLRQIVNFKSSSQQEQPSELSANVVKAFVSLYCVLCFAFCAILEFDTSSTTIILISVVSLAMLATMLIIHRQPLDNVTEVTFKVPLVPFMPCFSILINLYLMFQLDAATWMRFIVWLAVGYLIYFTYGIRNSVEAKLQAADDIKFVRESAASMDDVRGKDNPAMNVMTTLSEEKYRKVKDDL